ncbi:MAG: hypothetical protein ACYTFY_11405 [Planctomycetota bacterium]
MTSEAEDLQDAVSPEDIEEEDLNNQEQENRIEDEEFSAGEYDESAAPEGVEIQYSSTADLKGLDIPPALRAIIHDRLSLFMKLDKLNEERLDILKEEDLPDSVVSELNRQNTELRRLPAPEKAAEKKQLLKDKLMSIVERIKMRDPEVKPLGPKLEQAYKMAFNQWSLCIKRGSFQKMIIESSYSNYKDEPLYLLLKKAGISADSLFAWAIYALALDVVYHEQQLKHKQLLNSLKTVTEKTTGFFNKLRKSSKDIDGEKERLTSLEAAHRTVLMTISREISDIEHYMVKQFWHIYTEAAGLFVSKRVLQEEKLTLRALLRYGLISRRPYFISESTADHIFEDCKNPVLDWDDSMSANHILYADEIIELTATRKIPPSIDENLELNHRLSPEWKADKQWRRYIYTFRRERALTELAEDLTKKAVKNRKIQEEADLAKDKLFKNSPDYKKKIAEISQKGQASRVDAARFERAVDRIEKDFIPLQQSIRDECRETLEELEINTSPEVMAKNEAIAMHKVSRLCAKLKDPFPPFVLRDFYKLDTGAVNDRKTMTKHLIDLEKKDRLIFSECLFPVKKLERRIYMRFCPLVIIAPCCGFMGYSWNPRTGPDNGRLVLPAYCPRPGLMERILYNVFADFRWDTSKASAGVDLLTSDTLVASYANVRWDFRKKGKHIREKSAIYSEENDRQNFRRHYELFLMSAMDSGKRLFFKCHEVYDAFLRHMLLPEGKERLKK